MIIIEEFLYFLEKIDAVQLDESVTLLILKGKENILMKKWRLFALTLMVVLIFAACTPQQSPGKDIEDPSDVEESRQEEDRITEEEKTTIKLYYVSNDYVNAGDESLDKVIPVEKEVTLEGKKVEELIIEELKKSPEDENLSTFLENLNITSVEVEGDTAFVDFSSNNLYGSSLQETLVLQQIVFSLTELPNVEQVQILVDGEKQETLMGHMEITNPLKRSDVSF